MITFTLLLLLHFMLSRVLDLRQLQKIGELMEEWNVQSPNWWITTWLLYLKWEAWISMSSLSAYIVFTEINQKCNLIFGSDSDQFICWLLNMHSMDLRFIGLFSCRKKSFSILKIGSHMEHVIRPVSMLLKPFSFISVTQKW